MPGLFCSTVPVPLMLLAKPKLSLREKRRMPLLMTLVGGSVPKVPPLPNARVPPLMVVMPV